MIVYEIHFFFAYKTQLPDQHLQPHLSLNQWKQRADDSHSSTSESIWQKHSVTAICLFLSSGKMYFTLWLIFRSQTPWNRARQPYYCVDSLEHIFNKLTLISAVKYSKIKKNNCKNWAGNCLIIAFIYSSIYLQTLLYTVKILSLLFIVAYF